MAATSKTAGGRAITDENRAAMRAKARAYAAKGKPKIRAKDMPYGWAIPKAEKTGGSSGPPRRSKAAPSGGKTGGSSGPPRRSKAAPSGGKTGGSSGPPRRNRGKPAASQSKPASAGSTKTNPTGGMAPSKGLTDKEAKVLAGARNLAKRAVAAYRKQDYSSDTLKAANRAGSSGPGKGVKRIQENIRKGREARRYMKQWMANRK